MLVTCDRNDGVYDHRTGSTVSVGPGELIPAELLMRLRGVPRGIREVGTLSQVLTRKPARRVLIQRSGGLGDVCMLLPSIRAMQQRFPKTRFAVESRFPELFAADPTLSRERGGYDLTVRLKGWLELDHTGEPRFSHVPRVTLYGQVFGVPLDPPVSWDLPLLPEDDELARSLVPPSGRKTLALSLRGHAPHRTLGPKLHGPLIGALRKEYRLVVMDDDKGSGPTGDGIVNLAGKVNARQAVSALRLCDATVTTESGGYWLAHIAGIPTVCLFGPTRPEERLEHHPLWPRGVAAIVTNGMIDPYCPPCWGNGDACNARLTGVARCLNDPDAGRFSASVLDALRGVAG